MKNTPENIPAEQTGIPRTEKENAHTPAPQAETAPAGKEAKANPLTLKIVFIGIIMLILLIPGGMIMSLINERCELMEGAQEEVARMWSNEQHITGPVVSIPYYREVKDSDGKTSREETSINILPETLTVDGSIACQQLRRGLYDTNVYNSEITLTGSFRIPDNLQSLRDHIYMAFATVSVGISDLRGIEENIGIDWNGKNLTTATDLDNNFIETGVTARIDLREWWEKPGESVPFEIKLKLKGSAALYFAPVGDQTSIRLRSDCPTPSFIGNFLPSAREVTEQGFTAEWKVVAQNRNYGQVMMNNNYRIAQAVAESELGVNLLIPVTQYQQATRSVKYGVLVILLTFIGVLFVEMTQRKNIHAFQYLLVGLGLVLFYSLLVSISEHLSFGLAYLVAAVMTTALITAYIYGAIRIRGTALCIGALLAILYTYVYVLLQLETYALLAGSIGLFVILAAVMRYSLKMEWTAGK